MRTVPALLAALPCALLAATIAGGCKGRGSDTNEAIAVVNGTPVTKDEFYRYIMLKPRVEVQVGQGRAAALPVAQPIGLQALEDMVQRKVVRQMAIDEKVWPSEQEVVKELQFLEKMNPQLIKGLVNQGMTTAMVKEEIALNLAQERLLTQGVNVTDADVKEFIKKNPKKFERPAMADLLVVYVSTDAKKRQVDQDLKNQTFETVALRYSELPNARETRGRYHVQVVDQMAPEIKSIVANTKELQATDWKKVGKGWAKFYVNRKTAAEPLKLDDTRMEYIRREMRKARGMQANDLNARLRARLAKSDVKVNAPALEQGWKRIMDRMQAARTAQAGDAPSIEKTASAGTAGAAPGTAAGTGR